MPRPRPRDELTEAELGDIATMRAAGRSWDSIAEHYGVQRKWLCRRVIPERLKEESDQRIASRAQRRQQRRVEADRALRQQQHAKAMVSVQTSKAAIIAQQTASRAEARRLHAMGMKFTWIAARLKPMRYDEIEAAIKGGV
jgi:hypothetical protein